MSARAYGLGWQQGNGSADTAGTGSLAKPFTDLTVTL